MPDVGRGERSPVKIQDMLTVEATQFLIGRASMANKQERPVYGS